MSRLPDPTVEATLSCGTKPLRGKNIQKMENEKSKMINDKYSGSAR
jgi:hypothetical protein